jgi:hypothetical protein
MFRLARAEVAYRVNASGGHKVGRVGLATILLTAAACAPASVSTSPSPTVTQSAPAQSSSPTAVPIADPKAVGVTAVTLASRSEVGSVYRRAYVGGYVFNDLEPNSALPYKDLPLPSIMFVVRGTIRWTWPDGVRDISMGEAAATPTLEFQQSNPGPTPSRWYTFVVYSFPNRIGAFAQCCKTIAEGPEIPSPQEPGPHTIKLDQLTIDVGGRTSAATHSGAGVIAVLDGDVEVRQRDRHVFPLTEKGVGLAPDSAVQILNRGSSTAHVLEFFYTPDIKPFETPLTTPLN